MEDKSSNRQSVVGKILSLLTPDIFKTNRLLNTLEGMGEKEQEEYLGKISKEGVDSAYKAVTLPIPFVGGTIEEYFDREPLGEKVRKSLQREPVYGENPNIYAAKQIGASALGGVIGATTSPSTYVLGGLVNAGKEKLVQSSLRPWIEKNLPTFFKGTLLGTDKEHIRYQAWLKDNPTPTAKVVDYIQPKKAGNINLTKYSPEIQKGIREIVDLDPSIAKHKPISHAQTAELASKLESTPVLNKLFKMPEGQLRAETLKLRQGEDKLVRDILKSDLNDLGITLKNFFAHKQTGKVSKAAFEIGGALEQFKMPIKDQQVIANMIKAKIKSINIDPIISAEAKKSLTKGLTTLQKSVLSKQFNPTFFDKAYFTWLNSILSDPRTHMVNVGSNTLFSLVKIPEKFAQATADLGLVGLRKLGLKKIGNIPLTGKRTTYFGEIPAMVKGLGYKGKVPSPSGSKFEELLPTKGWEKYTPTGLLQVEDKLGKGLVGKMEMFSQAFKKGVDIRKGAKGLTGSGAVKAEQLYRTFQNEPGKLARSMLSLRGEIPLMRWLIPFVKTPANLISAGIERTVLGTAFLGKAKTQEQLAQRLGTLALGSVASAWIGWQYFKGNVTGDAPSNTAERDTFYREGKQPNSLKMFGHWVPLERIEPLGSSFAITANLIQRYVESDSTIPSEKVMDSIQGLSKTLTNKTYLSGLTNVMKATSNPEMYGANWGKRVISGMFSPGLLNYIANLTDPYIREAKTVPEMVMGRMPGLSKTVAPKLNALGEQIKRPMPAIPFRISKAQSSKVTKELKRLGIHPTTIDRKYKGIPLTSKERNVLVKAEGRRVRDIVLSLMGNKVYQNMTDSEKEGEITSQITKMRRELRPKFLQNKINKEIKRLKNRPKKERQDFYNFLIKNEIIKE